MKCPHCYSEAPVAISPELVCCTHLMCQWCVGYATTMMTVQKLISLLKKMPPRAVVIWRDHDQAVDEVGGWVGYVFEGGHELRTARAEDLGGRRVVVLQQ